MATEAVSPQIVSLGKERRPVTIQLRVNNKRLSRLEAVLIRDCIIAENGRTRRVTLAQIALEPVRLPDLRYSESALRQQITDRQLLNGPGLSFTNPEEYAFNNRGLYVQVKRR